MLYWTFEIMWEEEKMLVTWSMEKNVWFRLACADCTNDMGRHIFRCVKSCFSKGISVILIEPITSYANFWVFQLSSKGRYYFRKSCRQYSWIWWKWQKLSKRAENSVENGKIGCYEQFLLFIFKGRIMLWPRSSVRWQFLVCAIPCTISFRIFSNLPQ